MTKQRLKELDILQWKWSYKYSTYPPTQLQIKQLKDWHNEELEILDRLGLTMTWVHQQHDKGWPSVEIKETSNGQSKDSRIRARRSKTTSSRSWGS